MGRINQSHINDMENKKIMFETTNQIRSSVQPVQILGCTLIDNQSFSPTQHGQHGQPCCLLAIAVAHDEHGMQAMLGRLRIVWVWGGDTSTWLTGCFRSPKDDQPLPSGELTFWYGKSPFLMGKSTINGHFQLLC